MKILMVCLGNICRSPLAEGILKEKAFKAGLDWIIESAGTNGFHTGEPPHMLSQKVARIHGIDINKQRAKKFIKPDLLEFDKIYAMAADVIDDMKKICGEYYNSNNVELFLNELYPGQNRNVPDPWYGPEEGYHEVYKLIDEACNALIENYMVTAK
jgi:protein-tyrosine phosphatase